jgi:transcriptional regulator with XRE-family HTH domain
MSQSSMKNGAASQRAAQLIDAAVEQSPLSVSEVAERAGLPRTTLVNIRAGRANLYVEQLIQIAYALGVDAATWVSTIEKERRSGDELAERRAKSRQSDAAGNVLPSQDLGHVAGTRKDKEESDPRPEGSE